MSRLSVHPDLRSLMYIDRTAISIAGIICQAFNVLCSSESWNIHYAQVYLEAVDFVSIRYIQLNTLPLFSDNSFSVALYGLILFYGLTKEELAGRRPLAKFLSIKLIVMFTFYQSFMVMEHILTSFSSPLTFKR
jgi:hypothetical protein